ncbi:MAG: hypothetical protein ACLGJB_11395 [Blastocatellia bacterium]
MDAGEEEVEDKTAVRQLRLQARRIQRRALMLAVVLTLIAIVFP